MKTLLRKLLLGLAKGLIVIGVILLIIYFALNAYVDHQLAKRTYPDAYNSCHKIWATRGLVKNFTTRLPKEGNSIESIQNAFNNGAAGSEIDLFFDSTLGQFIISHDYPYNIKNGDLLTLEKLLNNLHRSNYLWLDFKKLRKLDAQSAHAAVKRLEAISQTNNWKDRIYIEGADPVNLGKFRDAGFKTLFDIHPLPESKALTNFILTVYKAGFYFGNFSVMGMKNGEATDPVFGPVTKAALGNIPLFIYHTPDNPETLKSLLTLDSVRVILMQDHALNRFDMNNCNPAD